MQITTANTNHNSESEAQRQMQITIVKTKRNGKCKSQQQMQITTVNANHNSKCKSQHQMQITTSNATNAKVFSFSITSGPSCLSSANKAALTRGLKQKLTPG